MERLSRRALLNGVGLLVGASALGTVLAACSSAAPPSPTVVPSTPAEATKPAASPAASPAATPRAEIQTSTTSNITLALWLIQLSPEQDKPFRAQVIDPFRDKNPGLGFDLQYTTWSNVQEKVLTAMAGGVGPDIFQSAPQWTPLFIGKPGKENLLALDSYLANWDGSKDFYDNVMSSCKMRGKTWGLPYGADTRAILYRKDIFKDAGLDPETPPKTWQDLADMATKTTKRNGDKWERAGYNVAPNFPNEFVRGQQWTNFYYQQGGEYFNEDFTKVLWNTDPGVKALQFMIDLIYVNKVCPLGGLQGGPTPAEDPFLTGKLAIQDGSIGALYSFKKYAPDKLSLVGFGDPLKAVKQVMFLGGNSLHIWSRTKHKDESWTGLSYLLSPGPIAVYGEVTNTPTTRISVNETAAYMKADPLLQDFARAGQYGKTVPSVPGGQQLSKFLSDAIDAATRKLVTAKQALDDAAQKANNALAQAARSNQ
jgi:multiple sugar transport system substrate-binding protein